MSNPVVITCAVTGGGGADSVKTNPAVPVTPAQIAAEVLAARKAGAAVAHIHVRDPATGRGTHDVALYREVVERVRDAGSDVLVNLTTGPGARFDPNDQDLARIGPASNMIPPEERVAHVLELLPDICSLDVATMNYGAQAFVNVPRHLEKMAKLIRQAGVKPELEVFDLGHMALAAHMYAQGLFEAPPLFQFCLGIPWGAPATTEAMLAMRSALPAGGIWAAFGISRHEFPMVAQAMVLGGNVRVGLEDNLYVSRGVLASGNAALVERAVTIIEALGSAVATPAEARVQLGLRAENVAPMLRTGRADMDMRRGAMLKKPRRSPTPAFKAHVAIAALKGDKPVAVLAEQFGVPPYQVSDWKTQLQGRAEEIFAARAEQRRAQADRSVQELQSRLGELTSENDYLKGLLDKLGVLSASG